MITKKQFIKILNHIIEEEDKQEKFARALKEYAPSDFTDYSKPDITIFLVEILEELVGDTPEGEYNVTYISWWLWDCPDRGRCEDDNSCSIWLGDVDDPNTPKIVVRTPEDLYDAIRINKTSAPSSETMRMVIKQQDEGVRFALKTIKDVKDKNFETHNEGWSERDAHMEYLMDKITNGYLMKAGINRDLNLDKPSYIISVLDEES